MKSVTAESLVEVNYSEIRDLPPEEIGKVVRRYSKELLPKPGVDYEVRIGKPPSLKNGERLITNTLSLCPECYSLITAVLYEKEGKVYQRKRCPEHGMFEELYFGDVKIYERFKKWQKDGKGIWTPHVELTNLCPYNCGLCGRHKSHTALLNLVVTNRCNLRCWYCFFFAISWRNYCTISYYFIVWPICRQCYFIFI